MKKLFVLLAAIAATTSLAIADAPIERDHRRPQPPAPVPNPVLQTSDYFVSATPEVLLSGRDGRISVVNLLGLRDGDVLNSIIVVAGSGSSRNSMNLVVNGQIQKGASVGLQLSAIQFPLRLVYRRGMMIDIEGHGGVLVSMLGATIDKNGAVPAPGPGPVPAPQPNPRAPICSVAAAGNHVGVYYKYRLFIEGQSREGASDLNGILQYVRQYENAGLCRGREMKSCKLANEGNAGGTYYRYRTLVNNEAWNGSSDIDSTLAFIAQLENEQLCRQDEQDLMSARCIALPAGNYAGTYYRYRVAIDKNGQQTVFYGTSDFNDAQNFTAKLRRAGQCN